MLQHFDRHGRNADSSRISRWPYLNMNSQWINPYHLNNVLDKMKHRPPLATRKSKVYFIHIRYSDLFFIRIIVPASKECVLVNLEATIVVCGLHLNSCILFAYTTKFYEVRGNYCSKVNDKGRSVYHEWHECIYDSVKITSRLMCCKHSNNFRRIWDCTWSKLISLGVNIIISNVTMILT